MEVAECEVEIRVDFLISEVAALFLPDGDGGLEQAGDFIDVNAGS